MKITRLFEFPYYQNAHYPKDDALVSKRNGKWVKTSTQEYIDLSSQLSRALIKLGVQKNDKVAIISSSNRTEWNISDIALLQVGVQTVPIYPTISKEEYAYILNHSESVYCFVSDQEVYEKVKSIQSEVSGLKEVFSFETISGCQSWYDLLETGKDDSLQSEVESRKESIDTKDLATIIYTSGTTGRPKGVMLSHENIVSNVLGSSSRVPVERGKTHALSFLPVCHVFERMILYLYQYYGISIYFAESLETIGDNLKEIKPNIMSVVPRLLEKVYDKIYAKGADLTGVKKKLFFWAIDLGLQYEPFDGNTAWYHFQLKIARKLIFSKWQEALGGNIEVIVSGSAALQPRLSRVFAAAGMPVMEGYGLTETSPVISVNDQRNKGFKVGTVGKIIDGVEVKIADDGEILCKGSNVMMGYYKDEEKTKEVITDGYFHTGDIGLIDEDGFLKITDRKKEMFKTSGGKYIAPQIIENVMKESRFIEQIMVIGEGQKMPAAFIQPNFEFVKDWAKIKGYSIGETNQEITKSPEVIQKINEEVEKYNEQFGQWEKIKKIGLIPDVWSVEGGHLTPTMKLKRKVIKEMYKELFEKIYS